MLSCQALPRSQPMSKELEYAELGRARPHQYLVQIVTDHGPMLSFLHALLAINVVIDESNGNILAKNAAHAERRQLKVECHLHEGP